jgi:hypothetical protein
MENFARKTLFQVDCSLWKVSILIEVPISEVWESFSVYSQESTIHSMNYLGKKNLHWIERLCGKIAD